MNTETELLDEIDSILSKLYEKITKLPNTNDMEAIHCYVLVVQNKIDLLRPLLLEK